MYQVLFYRLIYSPKHSKQQLLYSPSAKPSILHYESLASSA